MRWAYDRITRLDAIIERHLLMLKFLRSERLDTPRDARGELDRRIAYTEKRLAWFRSVARVMRQNAKRAEMATA